LVGREITRICKDLARIAASVKISKIWKNQPKSIKIPKSGKELNRGERIGQPSEAKRIQERLERLERLERPERPAEPRERGQPSQLNLQGQRPGD
jgi:hypothetical protein